MNILFYRYGSICEPDIIEAFKEYGINVYEELSEVTNKNITPSEHVDIISKALFGRDYSFVFSINFFPQISDVCNIFNIPYMCLIVDSPVMELYSNSLANPCNRVFLFDRALYDEFREVNPNNIFHVPLATNVKAWDKVISSADPKAFRSDVSFVGSLYTEKCPFNNIHLQDDYFTGYMNGIIEAQLKIYGYFFIEELITDELVAQVKKDYANFHKFLPGSRENDKASLALLYMGNKVSERERAVIFSRISEKFNVDLYTGSDTSKLPHIHNRGFAKTLTEMPIIFNHSRINLNITSKSIRSGLPLRIFDILGCGGFLITNYQTELPEFFNIGEHLAVYESVDDLEDKIAYYLEHEKERIEIARNGYEEVKINHNYTVRIGQMIEMAFGGK